MHDMLQQPLHIAAGRKDDQCLWLALHLKCVSCGVVALEYSQAGSQAIRLADRGKRPYACRSLLYTLQMYTWSLWNVSQSAGLLRTFLVVSCCRATDINI